MRIHSILQLGALALLACAKPAHAAESYSNCAGFIAGLPATISTSGTWCLKQNLSTPATTGNAITINADNVVLDCNDFQVKGSAGASGTSVGIKSTNHFHDTVRHCNVQGFHTGLYFDISTAGPYGGHVVEDNHFESNTLTGIHVVGDGSVVRRNLVLDTGGASISQNVQGIVTDGTVSISDNMISFMTSATGNNAYGIYALSNSGSIDHNHIFESDSPTGNVYGIYFTADTVNQGAGVGPMTITDNDLRGPSANPAGLFPTGLSCHLYALASRNIIVNYHYGITSCGDGGQNDISP